PLLPRPGGPVAADRHALRLRLVVVVVVVLPDLVTAVVVLDQAQVDPHLAHRAGHRGPPSEPIDHFRAGPYPTGGVLPPSNAVPTRRCVAPYRIAVSRSALIPADSMTASGWSARSRAATSPSPAT